MPVSAYPSKTTGGPRWLKYQRLLPDLMDITTIHRYEDKGASFNTTGDVAPQRWIIEYGVLQEATAAILDTHHEAAGFTQPFNFTDREGVLHTNVRYLEYEADNPKFDNQTRRVVLIKYPS
ncbi:MAG TPA: hypothetical protein VJS44_04610 [Pyrinomonadaceae bacterium]|nr:hypothetical protein [Pyrinomonadaceae bacterium]